MKRLILLLAVLLLGVYAKNVLAQDSTSVLYVPLIGITSVPNPLARPNGGGNVTYNYAVKTFIPEVPLADIKVTDDICNPVVFIGGDDNENGKLDSSETWRYTCTTYLSQTTASTATATGVANNITATHNAYTTVVVGSDSPPPLVSIVNITKVAYPLSLPAEGGKITYTYKVNNPGVVPLSDVSIIDNKCSAMSGKLGDTNGNNLLDPNEVWIYTCTTTLTKTTTNTAVVTATANGFKATDDVTLTVKVETPNLPETGTNPNPNIMVWGALSGILFVLIIVFLLKRKKK